MYWLNMAKGSRFTGSLPEKLRIFTAVLHRLFFTELSHRGRADGIQTGTISLYRSFVVRSALAQTCLPRFQYVFSNQERVLLP